LPEKGKTNRVNAAGEVQKKTAIKGNSLGIPGRSPVLRRLFVCRLAGHGVVFLRLLLRRFGLLLSVFKPFSRLSCGFY